MLNRDGAGFFKKLIHFASKQVFSKIAQKLAITYSCYFALS